MRYLKLYEEFVIESPVLEPEVRPEIKPDNENVYQDENGVYHISNWITY